MPNLINIDSSYDNETAVEEVVAYVVRTGYASGFGVTSINHAADQMKLVKDAYTKTDKRLVRHFIISFNSQESQMLMPEAVFWIGAQIASQIGMKYQIVFGVHNDTKCLHLHFGMNTVSYVGGHKVTHDHSFLAWVKQCANDILALFDMEIKNIEWNRIEYVDWTNKNGKKAENA